MQDRRKEDPKFDQLSNDVTLLRSDARELTQVVGDLRKITAELNVRYEYSNKAIDQVGEHMTELTKITTSNQVKVGKIETTIKLYKKVIVSAVIGIPSTIGGWLHFMSDKSS